MKLETSRNRIFGLDVFRAFAIILVVLAHGKFMLKGTLLEGFPYVKMIDGVDVFFVLSGFLIGGILLKELHRQEAFRFSDLLRFWKRRWFRTLPNYYLILLANFLVVRYGIIQEDIEQFNFHFISFTHNFKEPFYGFFWESWSLSIEEWFYIATPLLVFALCQKLKPKHSFLLATLVMILLPLLYRMSIYDPNIDRFWWDVTFRKTVLCRLDSIGYGLFFSWIYFFYVDRWKKMRIPAFLVGMALIIFVLNYRSGANTFYKQTYFFSLIPMAVMLLLPMAERFKKASGIIPFAIEHISKISYSMYLINLALVASVIRDNFPPSGGTDGLLKYGIYWAVVVVVSTLLFQFFEKPMMNLRDREFKLLK